MTNIQIKKVLTTVLFIAIIACITTEGEAQSIYGNSFFNLQKEGNLDPPNTGEAPTIEMSLPKITPTVRIQILGQVKASGYHLLKAGDRVSGAFRVGGMTEIGSLRNIKRIKKSGVVDTLDLYKYFFLNDQAQNPTVEDGDIIFVPIIESTCRIEGQILHPGVYELKKGEKMSELINMAGSFTSLAGYENITIENIFKPGSIQKINFIRVLEDTTNAANLEINPGDFITIPISPRAITVAGQVVKGGLFNFQPEANVYYYLGLAGGYTERAIKGDIKLTKLSGRSLKANEGTMVEPGDCIYVSRKDVKGFAEYITVISQVASTLFIVWQVAK